MLASYAQLEAAWVNAGGPRAEAPLMAAIAIAESHPPGDTSHANTDAINPNDNNGTQSSFGAWQISNGTHIPPAGNWNSLDVNARLAVQKFNSQGLGAWGTFTSGAWRQFFHGNVLTAAQGGGGGWGNIIQGIGAALGGQGSGVVGGDIASSGLPGLFSAFGAIGHVFTDLGNPLWWERVGKGAIAAALVGTGAFLVFKETETYDNLKEAAKKAGKETAGVVAK